MSYRSPRPSSTPLSAPIHVRSYRAKDREALRRVCFDTGMMGEPITPLYADRESFADMFTAYFTDYEPHNVVVAELDGKVVGYSCAALDTRRQRSPERYLLGHVLLRGVCFKAGCRAFFRHAVRDLLLEGPRKPPALDHTRYPSQMHINLLPEARRDGTATRLHGELLDRLKAQGSSGVFAETLASNEAFQKWSTRKLGYTLHGEPYLVPASRGLAGERVYNQIVTRSLADWQPGAWRAALNAGR